MFKYACNPFFIYGLSFLLILLLLSFGVSNLYYLEYNSLLVFILFTIILSFFIGYILRFYVLIKIERSFNILKEASLFNCISIVAILFALFLLDCISVGVIPIIEVLKGNTYRYMDFGVPLLHAFLIMYTCMVCFSYFIRYLKFSSKRYLFVMLFALFLPICFINRQVFIYEIIGLIILYFTYRKKINFTRFFKFFSIFLLVSIFFSAVGNYRTVSDSQGTVDGSSSLISGLLDVNTKYMPDFLSWPYAYIVTPYGNLQYNYKYMSKNEYGYSDFSKAVRLEIFPDFLSKRFVSEYDENDAKPMLISEAFNVVTGYSEIYVVYGVYGLILYFLYFCFVMIMFIILMPVRGFFISLAGLCATTYLITYSNMLYQQTQILFPIAVVIFTKFRFGNFRFV
ncbi:oligosaccharide repeat unit polymerase [Acinetobacter johnsonii]|uniref:O-antigen polymerase n=1 Tax=Acinetobacter johnsonii TaxID=40214 RepID=UPI00244C7426|nr:O-antigen ligase [Acinetobacter johnsonii]MDH0834297.1 oligosaccharide repeat unit polymerase [Acinetobacter johnsonii]MDH0838264.1 oligosaccharide repeat unit polymerase [Acinetobacter johnsonii]